MQTRPLVLGVLLVWGLSACRCGDLVGGGQLEPLAVSPERVELGDVYVGARTTASVTIRNPSRASRSVTLEVDGPFELEVTALVLGGGLEAQVGLSFAPVDAGSARGAVRVLEGTDRHEREVSARALAPLVCPAEPCHEVRFDAQAGRCLSAVSPDETSCTSGCFVDARCVAGQCIGRVSSCDDGDPCTVDACGSQGCVHLEVECPSSGPCEVGTCGVDGGCQRVAVEDGVGCGPSDCRTARVCIGGVCQLRARPGGAQACTYDDLRSSETNVCAHTLSSEIRCWGRGGNRAVNAPRTLARDLTFISGDFTIAAVDADGQPWLYTGESFQRLYQLDGGRFPGRVRHVDNWNGSVVLESGELREFDESLVRTNVLHKAWDWELLRDGGVMGAPTGLFTEPVLELEGSDPVRCVRTATATHCYSRRPTGTGLSGWREVLTGAADARLGSVFHFRPYACLGTPGGEVTCEDGGTIGPPLFFDGGLRRLTFGAEALCGLHGAGEISCAGSSPALLGDDSALPVGLVRAPLHGQAVAVDEEVTAVATDGGVFVWGRWGADAGSSPRQVSTRTDVVRMVLVRDQLALLDATGWLTLLPGGGRLGPVVSVARCENTAVPSVCGLQADGGPYGSFGSSTVDLPAVMAGPTSLLHDGGVYVSTSARPLALPGPAASISEGCALLATRGVWCWRIEAPTPTRITGVLRASSVVGDLSSGCARVGTNGVQCWGTNRLGRLGGLQPASGATAVTVPMPGPVAELVGSSTHSCVRLVNDEVWCWGDNRSGALGFEPQLTAPTPRPVTR